MAITLSKIWYYIGERENLQEVFYEHQKTFSRHSRSSGALVICWMQCKKDTGKEPLNAAGGKADEAMSENQPESTDAQASDTASEAAGNEASSSGTAETAKETQKPTAAATARPNKPDVKKSKYFLGTDLDGWYNWALAGKGYNEGANYIKVWAEEFDSHDNLVKRVSYKTLDGESIPSITTTYEYTYNSNGT